MSENRNVRLAARAAIAMLGLNAVYAVIESGASFRLRSLTSAQIEIIADIESLFAPMLFVTAALFISWAYLAHAHLAQMGRTHIYFRDGAAVWWWFAPIANLVTPFQVMYETARGSVVEFTDARWYQRRVPKIAMWWTVMFYAGWLSIQISGSLLDGATTTQQLDAFAAIHGIAYVVFGAAAIVTIAMILQITEAQEEITLVPTLPTTRVRLKW